jgi:hypothetical protein
MRDNQIDNMSN